MFLFVNGPAAHRATRISPERWEELKGEIVEVYLSSNLVEVATHMEVKHNFHATHRQYIYQFKKWGVKKQRTDPESLSGTAASLPLGTKPGAAAQLIERPPKRGRSTSTCPDNDSISSADRSTTKPVKKKHEYQGGANLPDRVTDSDSTTCQVAEPPRTSNIHGALAVPLMTQRTLRTIDHNRPADTFSGQDIASIRRAADYFAMLHLDHEAFEMYITLLKHGHPGSDNTDPRGILPTSSSWYLIAQCAWTASSAEHLEVIQKLIRSELYQDRPCDRIFPLRHFLLNLLLAIICHRNSDFPKAQDHLVNAGVFAPHGHPILAEVNPRDRAALLMLYSTTLLRLGEPCPLTSPESRHFSWSLLQIKRLKDCVLDHVTGPSEFQGSIGFGFDNTCIVSCLEWCKQQLADSSFAESWRQSHLHNATCTHCSGPGGGMETLFTLLWQQWGADGVEPLWAVAAQSSTGISATEMLMVTVALIYNCCVDKTEDSAVEAVRLYCEAVERVLGLSEMQLRRKFLMQYVSRNALNIWPCASQNCADPGRQLRTLPLSCVLQHLVETLGVTFNFANNPPPDSRDSGSIFPPYASPRASHAQPRQKTVSSTLASSLSSVDLSNFRMTGQSAAWRLGRFARGSLSTEASGTRMSIEDQNDLPRSMTSLSISSERPEERSHSSQHSGQHSRSSLSIPALHRRQSQDGSTAEEGFERNSGGMSTMGWI
ncbi:hypothetical protein QBC34DRAFT_460861 [Podospora aff. communis PSN243]|uniref:Clr5 domain-containing protein n=1 Tax=Podospora aff. communis PSN243 TaxID=3040156 RepID=A0AAV9GR83_9PEZI|nr:hypothetical protein QBC34DRAFT_460861 [Podospora aff. communis PSN243]